MGLLDSIVGTGMNDPQSQAMLALAGNMVRGDFGGGLLGAGQAYQSAQDAALKQKLTQAQLENLASEAALRKAQVDQMARRQQWVQGLLGQADDAVPAANQAVIAQTGNLAPTTANAAIQAQAFGKATANNPMAGLPREAVMADLALNDGKNLPEWMMKRPNIEFINNVAVDRSQVRPGFSVPSVSQDGKASQVIPDPTAPGGYRVIAPAGAMDTYAGYKGIDAGITAQTTPEKIWNPQTQRYEIVPRSMVLGGGAPAPAPSSASGSGSGVTLNNRGNLALDPAVAQLIAQDAAKRGFTSANVNFNAPNGGTAALAGQPSAPAVRAPQNGAMGMAAEPSVQEQSDAKANSTYADKVATDVAEQRKAIVNAGFAAPTNIAKYQKIGQLLSDVDGGKYTPAGTELASALNGFGIKIDKNLGNKQAAMAMANEAALSLRNPAGGAGMPGALSDADRAFLASMTPGLAQSADGRKQIIDAYVAVQQRNQQIANFARNYEKKYNRLDNGFFDQLGAWSAANPLFGSK